MTLRLRSAKPLPRSFYDRPTLDVARDLIGKVLVHVARGRESSGVIVETEAYIGESDPACHAAPGPTRRNRPLYGEPGFAYVYLNYGMHCLVNVVTEAKGSPAAVLIRALAPLDGMALMRTRRIKTKRGRGPTSRTHANDLRDEELCRGPGNLTRAMGITLAHNELDLTGSRLYVEDRQVGEVGEIAWGPRIGITVGTAYPWRCFVAGHRAVSGRKNGQGTESYRRPRCCSS